MKKFTTTAMAALFVISSATTGTAQPDNFLCRLFHLCHASTAAAATPERIGSRALSIN